MGFFDSYPRFFETSNTGASPNRLNKRHEAIFETVPDLFVGTRVLDIASHDGRWSFAALKAGASDVVGVEPRAHLVNNANQTMQFYECDKRRFRFIQNDIFNWLQKAGERFDAVLCLGFFYHTYRHAEIMSLIKTCRPKVLVLDTVVHKAEGMLCLVGRELVAEEAHAMAEESSYQGMTYVAHPTLALVKDYLTNYGFSFIEVDWRSLIKSDDNTNCVEDYANGQRVTLICHSND